MQHCSHLNKFLWVFIAVCCVTVLSSPTSKDEIHEIYTGSKRDASTTNPALTSALIKSALFNPYMYPLFPGKPFFYPLLTPPEVLLNRFAKSTLADGKSTSQVTPQTSPGSDAGTDEGISFAAKKKELLEKLFTTELSTRSVTPSPEDPDEATKPTFDPSFFVKKKFDFLDKLMKTFNLTAETGAIPGETSAPTPKPTIVPPSFWFPIIKPPKPPKAPKPTKPPKTKKILKDALDAAILQSFLADLGIDPLNGTSSKRAVGTAFGAKKAKTKKVKPEEEPTAFYIPAKIDPILYSTKASDCLDKLFKILSKADAEEVSNFIEPKATVIPNNLLNEPSETEYTSKLDAFLDLLIKSLNTTGGTEAPTGKPFKSKKPTGLSKVIKKRSTFLDELLHRIPPSPPPTELEPTSSKCACSTNVPCCCGGDCGMTDKSPRSLAFKPFGTGYWIPQYLYATKMSLYLDKLMDTINTAAVEDVSVDASSKKRSLASQTNKINVTGTNPREAALSLIIAELVDLKNDIVDAFEEGIKAQKTASTTKPYSPVGKSFKKPFWGGKTAPTPDPIEPIQKRIDILNGIFDNITEIEKTLLFGEDMENGNIEASDSNGSLKQIEYKYGNLKGTKGETSQISDDEIEKLKGLLQTLYTDKISALKDGYK